MNNNWLTKTISKDSLLESYDYKYGTKSDYAESQALFFTDVEVIKNLQYALARIDSANSVLSIGINNGTEILELQKIGLIISPKTSIVGFDVSKSALQLAAKRLDRIDKKLIYGDVSTGKGTCIETGENYTLKESSFDLCLAFTSLSSSNLYRRPDYYEIVKKLVSTMKPESALLIIAPHSTIENGTYKLGGTFSADLGAQDPEYAPGFISLTKEVLDNCGYDTEVFGEKFIFLLAHKS